MSQRCNTCEKVKPNSEYYTYKNGTLHAKCKECEKEYSRWYYATHKEEVRKRQKDFENNHRRRIRKQWRESKERATWDPGTRKYSWPQGRDE